MLIKVAGRLLLLAILGYFAGTFLGDVYIYIICFMLLIITILFWLFVILVNLLCKLFPENLKTTITRLFVSIFLIALLSFYISTLFQSGKIANDSSLEKLKALGYVNWAPAENNFEKRGVVQYNSELAFKGINLYNSLTLPEAYLIDMHGNIVHKWSKKVVGCNSWNHHVEMYENGDLLIVAAHKMLIYLDWNSNIKWKKKMSCHHDVCIDENKRIHVLTHKRELVFWHGIPVPIGNDYIVILSPDGKLEKKVSVFSLVKNHVPFSSIVKIYKGLLKIFEPEILLSLTKAERFSGF